MPSLVGDSGQVLGVLGWALTRIHSLPNLLLVLPQIVELLYYLWCCNAVDKIFQQWLCAEQSCELFTDIRRRGGASNVSLHS